MLEIVKYSFPNKLVAFKKNNSQWFQNLWVSLLFLMEICRFECWSEPELDLGTEWASTID